MQLSSTVQQGVTALARAGTRWSRLQRWTSASMDCWHGQHRCACRCPLRSLQCLQCLRCLRCLRERADGHFCRYGRYCGFCHSCGLGLSPGVGYLLTVCDLPCSAGIKAGLTCPHPPAQHSSCSRVARHWRVPFRRIVICLSSGAPAPGRAWRSARLRGHLCRVCRHVGACAPTCDAGLARRW